MRQDTAPKSTAPVAPCRSPSTAVVVPWPQEAGQRWRRAANRAWTFGVVRWSMLRRSIGAGSLTRIPIRARPLHGGPGAANFRQAAEVGRPEGPLRARRDPAARARPGEDVRLGDPQGAPRSARGGDAGRGGADLADWRRRGARPRDGGGRQLQRRLGGARPAGLDA